MCVRCSVLGLCSLHRQMDKLTTPAKAQLIWLQKIEPFEFVSGECTSTKSGFKSYLRHVRELPVMLVPLLDCPLSTLITLSLNQSQTKLSQE